MLQCTAERAALLKMTTPILLGIVWSGDKDDGGDDDNKAADEAREPADRGARDDVRRRRRCADGQPADGTHVARQRDDDDAGEE